MHSWLWCRQLPGRPKLWTHWTPGLKNVHGKVHTMGNQYMALVQLGNAPGVVADAIMDTGGNKTLVDLESTRARKLPVHVAKGSEFGTFYGLGSVEQAYVG